MLLLVSLIQLEIAIFKPLIDFLDNLTSNLSTFPYTTAQCEKFIDLLQSSRGDIVLLVYSRINVLTLPFFLSDRICDGHVVAYVGENLLAGSSGGDISDFFLSPLLGRLWSIICTYPTAFACRALFLSFF